jgi:predicted GNAT family N-acyltransferase
MHIASYPEAAVPTNLRLQVHALQNQAWPPSPADLSADTLVHDQGLRPLSMLLIDDGTVVAALDILRKTITHASGIFLVGGLSTVVTHKDLRGHGYGHRLVTAARTTMANYHLELALFTCDRPLQPFYERAGFELLAGTTLIGGTPDDPFPSDQPGFDKVTMAAFFTPHAQEAAPAFHDSRIPLNPGTIDKLW